MISHEEDSGKRKENTYTAYRCLVDVAKKNINKPKMFLKEMVEIIEKSKIFRSTEFWNNEFETIIKIMSDSDTKDEILVKGVMGRIILIDNITQMEIGYEI